MEVVTSEDRKKELHVLLEQMRTHPSRDWSAARARAALLTRMIAADARNTAA